jgi:hypothetical protein
MGDNGDVKAACLATEIPPLPVELLDLVALHIDTRRDVLAFGLACRAFYRIAVPHHSDYRALCAGHIDTSVWQHLYERKSLAKGIRSLHVLSTGEENARTVRVPRACRVSETEVVYAGRADALSRIARVLNNTYYLHEFSWSPPLSLRNEAERKAGAAVWAAIAGLPYLQRLTITQPLNPPGDLPVYVGKIDKYPVCTIFFFAFVCRILSISLGCLVVEFIWPRVYQPGERRILTTRRKCYALFACS